MRAQTEWQESPEFAQNAGLMGLHMGLSQQQTIDNDNDMKMTSLSRQDSTTLSESSAKYITPPSPPSRLGAKQHTDRSINTLESAADGVGIE